MTKRRVKEEKVKSKVKKLGPATTFLTLLKGFVASAVLYLPKSFVNGGYGFSILALVFSCIVTTYCSMLLLAVQKEIGASSYTEIGQKLYGNVGKAFVNLALCLS